MSIVFPTTLDTFTNTTPTEKLGIAGGIGISEILNNLNDSVEALEAKVGVNSSAVTTSHDYKLSGVTGSNKAVSTAAAVITSGKVLTITDNTTIGTNSITLAGGEVITFTATNALTFTTTGSTNVTLPTTGTLATLAGTEVLSGKTLTAPKIVDGGFIADANGNEQIIFVTTASAVNEIKITNGSTGLSPIIEASGETNVHLVVRGKGNGFTKKSVLDQSNTTNAYKHNAITLTGWGFILGDTTSDLAKAVTFGITATTVLSVTIAFIGYKDNSDPTAITDFATSYYAATCSASGITTGGFEAVVQDTNNTGIANTRRMGFSWTAICTLT